jgi:hypothetical protein
MRATLSACFPVSVRATASGCKDSRLKARFRELMGLFLLTCAGASLVPLPVDAAALRVAPLAKATVIDGDVGDAEWTGASVADQNFVQIEPAYGEPSPYRTIVHVGQTATALYVAIEAFDPDIDRLSAAITQRDTNVVQDDALAVLLDPFGDGRTAYIFRTNPLSTQEDGRISDNGRSVDQQWDGVWHSASLSMAAKRIGPSVTLGACPTI